MYKTTTAYFKLNIKRYRTIIALYTFICFAAFPLLAIFEDSIHDASRWALDSSLILYGLFMVAVAFTLPIVLFRFGLNKRSVDTYYAFPISRSKLYISHYFSGLIVYIIPMILNFMIGCLILRFRFGPEYIAEAFTVFFAALIVSTTLYSINTLIVNKANNLIDALILCFAYLLLPFFIYLALNEFIGSHLVTLSASTLLNKTYIEYFLSPLTVMFQSLNSFANDYLNLPSGWVMYDLMFTVVFFIWGLHVFKNKRGEDAEQVSKDFFTYPLIVNVFSVIFISLFDITNHEEFSDIIIFLVVTFILYLIMHFVSRRSLKLTRQLVLKYVLIVAAFSVFNIVARQTEFFGINRYVRDPYEYEQINITYNDYINGDKTHQVVISMNHITEEEEALLSQLEDLQKMASQQFKAGKYWYDNPDFPSGNNIWIDVGYVTSISDGYNDAYMHYVFAEDDVKFFTDNELFVEISYDEEIK